MNYRQLTKKRLISLLVGVLCFTLVFAYIEYKRLNANKLSERIIRYIDQNCTVNKECEFFINDVVDFQWDRLVLYQAGANERDVSEALGVTYDGIIDISSGFVFAYQGKIVYRESVPIYTFNPSRLAIITGTEKDILNPSINVVENSNPIFVGKKYPENKIPYSIKLKGH